MELIRFQIIFGGGSTSHAAIPVSVATMASWHNVACARVAVALRPSCAISAGGK